MIRCVSAGRTGAEGRCRVPRLLDEWQLVPEIWGSVRGAIDDRAQPGQFILTGSAVPVDNDTRHTGAARFIRIKMRPCTLAELGVSSGAVSLAALLNADVMAAADTGLSVPELLSHVTVGGFPVTQRALRGLRFGAAASQPKSTP